MCVFVYACVCVCSGGGGGGGGGGVTYKVRILPDFPLICLHVYVSVSLANTVINTYLVLRIQHSNFHMELQ